MAIYLVSLSSWGQNCSLCLVALLSGVPRAQPLPSAATEPASIIAASLASREDSSLQPRQYRCDDGDDEALGSRPHVFEQCLSDCDELQREISALPG
ncbi:hypothetical protein PG993_000271 [Apiospora rasikravindrae]|uniref:Secreted protein n=1 Tax=Apiospora rasikravindrae TaxID=990691 RepID=A0ABR1U839_9PEZI